MKEVGNMTVQRRIVIASGCIIGIQVVVLGTLFWSGYGLEAWVRAVVWMASRA